MSAGWTVTRRLQDIAGPALRMHWFPALRHPPTGAREGWFAQIHPDGAPNPKTDTSGTAPKRQCVTHVTDRRQCDNYTDDLDGADAISPFALRHGGDDA